MAAPSQSTLLERYKNGREERVWRELRLLGPMGREHALWDDAYATACETMSRVKSNIETVHRRLMDVGYEFLFPDHAYVPAGPDAADIIATIEESIGSMPLSLRAFFEIVGSVDFCQSPNQLARSSDPRRDRASEVEYLGEENPLVVHSLGSLGQEVSELPRRAKRLEFVIANDEFFKANCGGGEPYSVWLPDENADFRIEGLDDGAEYFVDYLRKVFQGGGFRGKLEPLSEDWIELQRTCPKLGIVRRLAEGLLEF